jgi:hypothetical protein
MLTHGNLVADSAGMIRATYVAPGIVQTAYGTEESVPGKLAGCMSLPGAVARMTAGYTDHGFPGNQCTAQMQAQLSIEAACCHYSMIGLVKHSNSVCKHGASCL